MLFTLRSRLEPGDAAAVGSVPWASRAGLGWVRAYRLEYHKARAAASLFEELSRLSDAELAAKGVSRDEVAALVHQRIYN